MWPTGFLTEPEEAGTRDQQENILWLQSMADRIRKLYAQIPAPSEKVKAKMSELKLS